MIVFNLHHTIYFYFYSNNDSLHSKVNIKKNIYNNNYDTFHVSNHAMYAISHILITLTHEHTDAHTHIHVLISAVTCTHDKYAGYNVKLSSTLLFYIHRFDCCVIAYGKSRRLNVVVYSLSIAYLARY